MPNPSVHRCHIDVGRIGRIDHDGLDGPSDWVPLGIHALDTTASDRPRPLLQPIGDAEQRDGWGGAIFEGFKHRPPSWLLAREGSSASNFQSPGDWNKLMPECHGESPFSEAEYTFWQRPLPGTSPGL